MAMANMMSECLSGKVFVAGLYSTDLYNLVSLAGHKLSEIENRIKVLKSDVPEATMLAIWQPKERTSSNDVEHGFDLVPGANT
ncbi:hypothetical protein Hanom_Chr06g00526821 [Helianthus anomalus]